MTFFYENKQIVTPGDLIAEGDYMLGMNTYREGSKIYASRLGLVEIEQKKVHVVALNTFFIPSVGDQVIGKITEVNMSGWSVNINSPYVATLRASEALNKPFSPQRDDLSRFLDIGDLIIAVVIGFDRTRDPSLTIREPGLGKVTQGQIIIVSPAKIPRVIGRNGSMVSMIKDETGCKIIVGKNGPILISGEKPEDERLAVMAIQKIEQEAHTSGLTVRVTEMIRKEKEALKK